MSTTTMTKLQEKLVAAGTAAEAIIEKYDGETEFSAADRANLEALDAEASALTARLEELVKFEEAAAKRRDLDARMGAVREQRAVFEINEPARDFGTQFVQSEAFTSYAAAPAGNSSRMTLDLPLSSRYAVANATVTGSLVPKQRTADVFQGVQANTLLEVMGYEPVSGNSLEWIEWPLDPTGTVTAENVTKTESVYTPSLRTGSLEKIAHHTPFTREIMEDVPRFTAILNGALLRGVRRKAETNAAAALVSATLPANAAGKTLTEAIRLGIAEVEDNGFNATVCVVNPFDAAAIDIDLLAATNDGAQRRAGAWGIQVVTASSVTAGTAYVGDFQEGMTLFDRQVTNVYMTDSHAAEFVDNVLRVLAEARMKAVVVQPQAICEVTVDVTP